jgi:CheY-like chemotaxis protein
MTGEQEQVKQEGRPDETKGDLQAGFVVRPKVLVVDDKYMIRMLVRRYLGEAGYEVLEAIHGVEALQRFMKEHPQAIIMDIQMPRMNGLETCRQIRGLPEGKGVPIIMCTANADRESVKEAIQAGANDYVVKPFGRNVLMDKIAKFVPPPVIEKPVVKKKKEKDATPVQEEKKAPAKEEKGDATKG